MTILHHGHRRIIADTNGTNLGRGSWQLVNKTVVVSRRIFKVASLTFRQRRRRLGGEWSTGFAGTEGNGHEDRRGTQMAVIPEEEKTNHAKASPMG